MESVPRDDIARRVNERPERYEARVAYLLLGANRSLEAVAQKYSKHVSLMRRWSAEDGWVEQARLYDTVVAQKAHKAHILAYKRELEEHRERAGKASKALYGVAVEMLGKLRAAPVEYTPATLATIARALTTALDIEAHALRVADLLPKLDDGQSD